MPGIRHSSIQRKLVKAIVATSVVTLLLASVLFTINALIGIRGPVMRDINGLAAILSDLCQEPLLADNATDATRMLSSLRHRQSIRFVGVYNTQGRLFARYPANSTGSVPPGPTGTGYKWDWDRGTLSVWRPISGSSGAPSGSILIHRDLADVRKPVWHYGMTMALMAAACVLVAYLLASRLARPLSAPVLELARTAEEVARAQDYSIRAKKANDDEIGGLVDRFNEMLERIEAHDAEHLRLHTELTESREKAMEANRAKSDFLARMSHELRTPLNAIIGYSEMLVEEAEDIGQEAFTPDLHKITGAGKHLLMLINDILDLSKIEAGKMTLCPETFPVDAMIQDVATTITPLVGKNGNRLEIHTDPELGEMHADLTKVRQSLYNLLSNAAKFTERGVITLEAERRTENGADNLVFRVADTGIGMDTEQIGRLFQPFTQADPTTTRKFGGTGLGLTITRKFCEMMGGFVDVDSSPGNGSTFTILLPAHGMHGEVIPPAAASSPAGA